VSVGPLPRVGPLLEWRQDNPRVGVVLCDRKGAEIHVMGGLDPDREDYVEGRDFPITKVKAGGSAEARIHRRAENTWEANARAVAEDVNRMRSEEHLELVVVAGDIRAIGFLDEQLGEGLDRVALEMEIRPEVGLDEVADELQRAVAAYAGQTTEDLLARFREERGQQDLAADGVEATLAALRMAQVDMLLVSRDVSGSAWFSPSQPAQVSERRATIDELGLEDALEASLEDVAIAVALLTGATVRVVPTVGEEHGPRDGIGALLRFRT
ncbi:MAG TPA: Vms1/Ankzf1 family peptidyl-tRNA hydrolase, partial [Actinomycetota bacterium]|nr:Vms1/Ankzf1 family peptidyl-tRNA hydrolase [Actinomycetota bacterium]